MALPIADIGNTSLWEEVYTTSIEAERPYPGRYIAIGEILVPIILTQPLVAAYVSTRKNVSFRTGGWISKNVSIGLTLGNNMNTKSGYSRRLMLGQPHMILWEGFGQSYKLKFAPWKQLDHVEFRVWQFTGEITQLSDEQLAALRVDLLRVEKTLEFVANRDVPTEYDITIE